eukprot:gene30795-40961_t
MSERELVNNVNSVDEFIRVDVRLLSNAADDSLDRITLLKPVLLDPGANGSAVSIVGVGGLTAQTTGLADYVHNHLSLAPAYEDVLFDSDDLNMFPKNISTDVDPDENGDIIAFGVRVDINPEFPLMKELKALLLQFGPTLFGDLDEKGMTVDPMEIKLRADAKFTAQPCHYISPKLLAKVKDEIDRLVKMGILVQAGVTPIASPLVVVPKPDTSIRLAVDYRQLNAMIQQIANQLPFMKTFFIELGGKKYFAIRDNLFEYYQLRIARNSQHLTAIITPWGNYEFTRYPFGISTAPDEFNYRLSLTFKSTVEYNVRLKLSKCRFGYEEVKFLGHIFNKDGVKLGDDRKQGIAVLPRAS